MKYANEVIWLNYFDPVTARELVVSAGNNVEVTLPSSEVELNAFVVPAPPSGNIATCIALICLNHLLFRSIVYTYLFIYLGLTP